MDNGQLVPELRFPEFEGEWKRYKLGDISEISSGGTPKRTSKEYWNGEIPWVTTSEIGQRWIYESNEKITKLGLDNSSAKIFEPNTILMAMYGQGKTRGQVSQLKIAASTNQACAAIKLNSNIFPDFIYFALFKDYTKLRDLSNDGSQKNLSAGLLKGYRITKPELKEQQKIANFLTAIDQRITKLKEKKAALEHYKKGLMQKIFSQEVRFMDDEGNDFPDWEDIKLGDLCKITTGRLDANAMCENGKYRFYTCAREHYYIDKYAFDSESLLISGNGANVGYIHYYKGKFNAYQRTYVLSDFDQNIIYIQYVLSKYLKGQIDREKKAGNTPYIVMGTLVDMSVPLPSKKEQKKIANFLSAIDQKINAMDKQIADSELFKKGLLQRMFV